MVKEDTEKDVFTHRCAHTVKTGSLCRESVCAVSETHTHTQSQTHTLVHFVGFKIGVKRDTLICSFGPLSSRNRVIGS